MGWQATEKVGQLCWNCKLASNVILGGNDGAIDYYVPLYLGGKGIYLFIMFLYIQGLSDLLEISQFNYYSLPLLQLLNVP